MKKLSKTALKSLKKQAEDRKSPYADRKTASRLHTGTKKMRSK